MAQLGLVLYVGRELPTWDLWCLDATRTVVNLSSATCAVAIRQNGSDSTITATITTSSTPSGDGSGDSDVPSANVAPAADALDNIVAGLATVILTATSGGLVEEWQFPAVVNT